MGLRHLNMYLFLKFLSQSALPETETIAEIDIALWCKGWGWLNPLVFKLCLTESELDRMSHFVNILKIIKWSASSLHCAWLFLCRSRSYTSHGALAPKHKVVTPRRCELDIICIGTPASTKHENSTPEDGIVIWSTGKARCLEQDLFAYIYVPTVCSRKRIYYPSQNRRALFVRAKNTQITYYVFLRSKQDVGWRKPVCPYNTISRY